MLCDVVDYLRRVEVFNQDAALWVGKHCYLIASHMLILLGFIEDTEISFLVLIEFEMFLQFFEGV